MPEVFISYARRDRDKIEALASALKEQGYDVWWDHQIAGGAAFAAEIEQALHKAKCVVVAWSVKSVQSEWVLDEASVAKAEGKIVPIRLDATPAPLGFRQFQAIDFSSWRGDPNASPIQELATSIKRFLVSALEAQPPSRLEPDAMLPSQYADALAVLPFENLTGSDDQQYFVDGMHEALIIELSKISALKIVSRTSVKRYSNSKLSLREIAAELGVSKIVEASVMRFEEDIRISVQLIDARTDAHLWADSFIRNEKNILKLQQDVVAEVAQHTSVALTPEDNSRLGLTKNVKTEAYEAYLKGMYHWYKLSPEDTKKAIDYFDDALAIDPQFAPAHTGVAAIWAGIQQMGEMSPLIIAPKIKAAAERALEIDPRLYQAHFMWATYLTWSAWDWERAEQAFQRAIELNPNFPDSHAYYSHFLNIIGRFEEARRSIDKALNLDPFNPLMKALYGVDLIFWGQFDDAVAELNEIRKTAPDHWLPLQVMRFAYHELGKPDEAFEVNRELYRVLNKPAVVNALDMGFKNGGYCGAMLLAANELERMSAKSYIAPTQIAALYGWGGDGERAADWVEASFEQRDPDMPYIKNMYWLSPATKEHPRIAKVVQKMNYPDN